MPTTQSTRPLLLPTAFSQSSLQAYEDCPRRFWLTFVEQLPWPAQEVAPVQEHEHLMRLGETFHRLIERAEIGIDATLLNTNLPEPLDGWFAAYLSHRPRDLPTTFIEVEKVLSTTLAHPSGAAQNMSALRLVAKYDLIAAEPDGRTVILDWKTARRRTDPTTLRRRVQSWLYPYVLVEASRHLPWGPILPEQVEMRYWFTAAPAQPVRFVYDALQHQENREKLEVLLARILGGGNQNDFPLIPDTDLNRKRFCNFCIYRSRCNRGQVAGDLAVLEDDEQFFAIDLEKALEFTLEDVEELAF